MNWTAIVSELLASRDARIAASSALDAFDAEHPCAEDGDREAKRREDRAPMWEAFRAASEREQAARDALRDVTRDGAPCVLKPCGTVHYLISPNHFLYGPLNHLMMARFSNGAVLHVTQFRPWEIAE